MNSPDYGCVAVTSSPRNSPSPCSFLSYPLPHFISKSRSSGHVIIGFIVFVIITPSSLQNSYLKFDVFAFLLYLFIYIFFCGMGVGGKY